MALEFQRNRLNAIGDNQTAYEKVLDNVKIVLEDQHINRLRDPQHRIEVRQILKDAEQEIQRKLKKMRDLHVIPLEDAQNVDPILKALDELIDDKAIGTPPTPEDLKALKATAMQRINDLIPPGYSDAKGKDDPTGDCLVWFELLDHAKTSSRPLLFVTGDRKEDWYRTPVRGRSIGPRAELIAEMNNASGGQLYHQVPLELFLDLTNMYLDTSVEEATIETVRNIGSSTFVNAEALANMYPGLEISRQMQDNMQAALNAYLPKVPDLAEALNQRQWNIAASLALRPDFQSQIPEVLRKRQEELMSSYAGKTGFPNGLGLYAQTHLPTATEAYEKARAAMKSPALSSKLTTSRKKAVPTPAGKKAAKEEQPKKRQPKKDAG